MFSSPQVNYNTKIKRKNAALDKHNFERQRFCEEFKMLKQMFNPRSSRRRPPSWTSSKWGRLTTASSCRALLRWTGSRASPTRRRFRHKVAPPLPPSERHTRRRRSRGSNNKESFTSVTSQYDNSSVLTLSGLSQSFIVARPDKCLQIILAFFDYLLTLC